jgi:hypothetical protein
VVARKEGKNLYRGPAGFQTSRPLWFSLGQVQEQQGKSLLRRPADLALVIYLILAAFFTLFRGLVSLLRPAAAVLSVIRGSSSSRLTQLHQDKTRP